MSFSIQPEVGGADTPGTPAQRGSRGASPLPSLNRNNSNGVAFSPGAKKTAFKVLDAVKYLSTKHPLETLGFQTITFPEGMIDPKEASRRMNNLITGVIRERYPDWIAVYERGGKGLKPHFHLIVATGRDIRTGCNFEEIAKGDYRSANPALREEWAFWRGLTNYDGKRAHLARYPDIGRTEILPVKSNAEGLAAYAGKYIEKHMGVRLAADKGVRLLRMSRGLSRCTSRFGWHSPGSALWRLKLAQWSESRGIPSFEHLKSVLGSKWSYRNRRQITEWVIDWTRVTNSVRTFATKEGRECVDLRWWDELDRINLAQELRLKTGCAIEDAFEYFSTSCLSPEKRGMLSRITSGEPF